MKARGIAMNSPEMTNEIFMNEADLYREITFTDNRIGTIRQMQPITTEGEDDTQRPSRFFGTAQLMTPAGALPLAFEIPADNLKEAAEAFDEHAQEALEETMREIEEMRREAQSSIVVPGAGGGGQGGVPGGMPGAGGGFGGIKMP